MTFLGTNIHIHLAHLRALGRGDHREDGDGAPVSEDGVYDGVVHVVFESRVHGRQLYADHQGVLFGVGLGKQHQRRQQPAVVTGECNKRKISKLLSIEIDH